MTLICVWNPVTIRIQNIRKKSLHYIRLVLSNVFLWVNQGVIPVWTSRSKPYLHLKIMFKVVTFLKPVFFYYKDVCLYSKVKSV